MILKLAINKHLIFGVKSFFKQTLHCGLVLSKFNFTNITDLTDKLEDYSNQLKPILNATTQPLYDKFLKLSEQEFVNQLKQAVISNKLSPSQLLMFINAIKDTEYICELLILLYPQIHKLQSRQLLLVMEKVLAFEPKFKPSPPKQRALNTIQAILVIMSQIYNCDYLVGWLSFVPIYDGDSIYLLSMGVFSIIQKLSNPIKNQNKDLIQKCLFRIQQLTSQQDVNLQIGIAILAYEMNIHPLAVKLTISLPLDLSVIDPYKTSLFLMAVTKYIQKISKDGVIQQQYFQNNKDKKLFKQIAEQLLLEVIRLDWSQFMKLTILKQFWTVLAGQKISKQWISFSKKLARFTSQRENIKILMNMSDEQIIMILSVMEIKKIDHEGLLKSILTILSKRVDNMKKDILIKMVRCLVTYVRQCEDYLMDIRKIIQRRVYQLTPNQIEELNDIFRRVQVLFPKPLSVSSFNS